MASALRSLGFPDHSRRKISDPTPIRPSPLQTERNQDALLRRAVVVDFDETNTDAAVFSFQDDGEGAGRQCGKYSGFE